MSELSQKDFEFLDQNDPLASFRQLFELPEGHIYADGNSLGVMPKAVIPLAEKVLKEQWAKELIRSWVNHDWINIASRVGDKIATLIGAEPDEVLACDSTSVNLFKLAVAALKINPQRNKIITANDNFPTDLYILQGIEEYLKTEIELVILPKEEILAAVDEKTALVALTHVHFKTGLRYDMKSVTKKVKAKGALMLWDLCHSVGAMEVELNACEVDLAIGCGYKYLNGGPGAPAFLFVAKRHQQQIRSPLSGWLGHADPFAFSPEYQPAEGIRRMTCGTPSVLASSILEVAVEITASADMKLIREKSIKMGDLFRKLIEQRVPEFTILTPENAQLRGSHFSICHDQGYAIIQALIDRNIIGDFRAPNVLRFGITPLYMRYQDIWHLVDALADIMKKQSWNNDKFKQVSGVT